MKTHSVIAAVMILVQCCASGSWDAPVVESREVLENAAGAGDAVAQFKLALAFQEGSRGGPKDMARALAWYRKAAAGGVTEAQYNLGVIMANGVDAPRDLKDAARWFCVRCWAVARVRDRGIQDGGVKINHRADRGSVVVSRLLAG